MGKRVPRWGGWVGVTVGAGVAEEGGGGAGEGPPRPLDVTRGAWWLKL